ncbi:MAG TPA: hypothetical protein VKW04_24490 [Planctomycetota bacterium]|nr:hypothetical protein [Planctomycetota bacterium]
MVDRCEICRVLLRPSTRPRTATCERGACGREYRRRIESTPGGRACPVCGRRLEAGEETCGDPYCRDEIESRRNRTRLEEERLAARESAVREVQAGLRTSRSIPVDAVVAVLPASDRPLVPQEAARRAQFAERLSGLMEDAAADGDGPTGDAPSSEGPANAAEALARAACASCQGLCCRHGEHHAFLRPATLRRYLRRHPDVTPAQALDTYLSYLPAHSIAGSCLYHGRQGCTLPRELRSDVCNRYLCDDLERLQTAAARRGGSSPTLAFGFDHDRLVRVSLLEGGAVRPIAEGDLLSKAENPSQGGRA